MKVKRTPKRQSPPSKDISDFVDRIVASSEEDLPSVLRLVDIWKFPRVDLAAWIQVLDRFDTILEETIKSYDLVHVQTNDFTPKTKELVLEVLRFIKLLVENSTNRKLFSSYERIYDLLLTSDLDILYHALALQLRLLQIYLSNTPFEVGQLKKTTARLLVLARWDPPGGLFNLATSSSYSPPEPSPITYYSNTGEQGTVDITQMQPSTACDELAQISGMSGDDQLAALQQIRIQHMEALETRQKMVSIKLLSIASYLSLSNEDTVQSKIILYEPDLIAQTATIISSASNDHLVTSAMLLMDSGLGHRQRLVEIATALTINLSHGILLNLFREAIKTSRPDVIDSIFQFIAHIITAPHHGNMLIGAGLIGVVLQTIGNTASHLDPFIFRATGLLDALMYSLPPALTMFSNNDGLNTLVNRIKYEITAVRPVVDGIVDEANQIAYNTNPLKGALRTVHRLMQASGGSEGLRNLVDSELPKSIRAIFEQSDHFGPRAFSTAINIMATFVHNEPTSLSVLQELGLPQTLYKSLETSTSSSFEVLHTIPGAIGAICLNSVGLDFTKEHPMVIKRIPRATLEDMEESTERDSITHLGGALDELVRHHPALRPICIESILETLQEVCKEGQEFVPEGDDYAIPPTPPPSTAPNNAPLKKLSKLMRFLEGVLRNSAICKDFLEKSGLEMLLSVSEMPCLPTRFGMTAAAVHLSQVVRVMGTHDHVILVNRIVEASHKALQACPGDIWEELRKPDFDKASFTLLRGAVLRVTYLSEALGGLSFQHSRVAISLIKALKSRSGFLDSIGRLYHEALKQVAALKGPPPRDAQNLNTIVDVEADPKEDSAAKFIALRTISICGNKLLFTKRNLDDAHKREASDLAKTIAVLLVQLLDETDPNYDTISMATVILLLFDDRGTDGHLNVLLFAKFVNQGGIAALIAVSERILARGYSEDSITALRVVVNTCAALVSPRALLESSQISALEVSASDLLVKLRHDLLPILHQIWNADWLSKVPVDIVKRCVRAFLVVLEGKSEEATTEVEPPVRPQAPPRPATADPTRVEQLTEMGFPREAAEYALIRARNNVAAATELLLTSPHLFEDVPAPAPEAPAPAEAPAEAEPASEERPASPATFIDPEARKSLQTRRDELKPQIKDRAITLLDELPDIVFDITSAFTDDLVYVADKASEPDLPEKSIAARLRLLVILLQTVEGTPECSAKFEKILGSLPLEATRPEWLPAAFYLSETVLGDSHLLNTVKLGDDPKSPVLKSDDLAPLRSRLRTACLTAISDTESSRDIIASALRALVVITRKSPITAESLSTILTAFNRPEAQGNQAFLAMIIRHSFESQATITQVMNRELQKWFATPTAKVTDITHFVRQLKQIALRDPSCFVDVAETRCTLVDPTPAQSVFHIRCKDSPPEITESDPFKEDHDALSKETMQVLVQELLAVRLKCKEEDATPEVHNHCGLLLSLLTEIVGSYIPAKQILLSACRTTKSGIMFIIGDLAGNVTLDDIADPKSRKMAISQWASVLIVALCADIQVTADMKTMPEPLVSVRRTVIDAISRSIKDLPSITDVNARYGRLWVLGDLIHRLLAGYEIGVRTTSESTNHLAKMMIERNLVGSLTAAVGEVDLAYPRVKTPLGALLRALESLSKISIKWGKSDSSKAKAAPSETSESEGSDYDMQEDEDTPDLYRNSALGILGGDNDEDDEDDLDDEEEEDDDMMMQFGEDVLDEMDEEENTEPSDDDDDDSMHDEEDPEEDWTDDEQVAIIDGDVVDREVDDAAGWQPEEPEDQEYDTDEENAEEDMYGEGVYEFDDEDEDEMNMGMDMDMDMDMEMDMDMQMDDEDYDELEAIGPAMGAPRPTAQGSWGWEGPPRPPSSSAVHSALFGEPRATNQHPVAARPETALPPPPLGRNPLSSLTQLFQHFPPDVSQQAFSMLERLIARQARLAGEHVQVDLAQAQDGAVELNVGGQRFHIPAPSERKSTEGATDFGPRPTNQRWHEELSITPGNGANSMITRLVMLIVNRLMPEAKTLAEEAEVKRRKEEAEQEEKRKAEAVVQEEKDRKAAEEALASASAVELPPSPAVVEPMEVDPAPEVPPEPEPAPSLARTLITIHGEEVDITDTGIDLEFLQALPDEMRADVVEQHLREQNRTMRAATNVPDASAQINSEFLDALPPDIRAEIIMQEALEATRGPRRPEPMAALARTAGQGLFQFGFGIPEPPAEKPAPKEAPQKPHREAVQLLDKNGIASLVKLLFFPETFRKPYLLGILGSLCENSSTRSDLLNLLLSVVQDGSGDLPAVDRSFQQLSLRGTATPKVTPKVKVPESPATAVANAMPVFSHLPPDHIPTFIAQKCFEALAHIVRTNQSAVQFFLTEHEQGVGLKKLSGKKGKGKDKMLPQIKFPIVILLGLLDRPILLKTSTMLESITRLLAQITKPIANMKPPMEPLAEVKESEAAAPQTPGPSSGPSKSTTEPPKTPPNIPPSVLRLVVNCLTAGDCSSRAFHSTLSVMRNLSFDPIGKEVILSELRSRCQALGTSILEELGELSAALQKDEEAVDSVALAKFSPQSSSQAQLLRLLKTIDYLHTEMVDSDRVGETLTDEEKAVSESFGSFNFDPMWKQLSDCLAIVEERGTIDQNAVVLLPLVEALMVICKYRERSGHARSPSIPPSASQETTPTDLFVSFTTAHRKVLNAIVRNNPALLSGSFSLLIRNPKVLEFDNKRQWFFQKLKRKKDQPSSSLQLTVRRQDVLLDSFKALQARSANEIKFGKINVRFQHEDGVDAGGVTREWYSVLAQQIFDPNFALFEPCAADKQTYQPNKASSINSEHLLYFKFIGRIIGKAVFDGRLLDAYFSRAFYKQILGKTLDMRDLESIDPEYHKSLQWMLENDITGVIDQEFTIEDDEFGEKKVVELKDGGASIPVTEDNKEEYVQLVVSYRLDNSIKQQIKAFLEGFYEIIPRELIQIFEPDQLELLISGITTIDVDELKNATQMSGWKASDPEVGWFWRALRSYSQEERARFLMFVTSSSRVPLGGYTQLQGASGIQPFQLQKLYSKDGSLPQASTCFNLLLLPKYDSYEQLRDRLLFAMTETSGFGKA